MCSHVFHVVFQTRIEGSKFKITEYSFFIILHVGYVDKLYFGILNKDAGGLCLTMWIAI